MIRRLPPAKLVFVNTAVRSQKAVSAYFTSKQILPFGFAEQNTSIDLCVILLTKHLNFPVYTDSIYISGPLVPHLMLTL